MGSESRLGLVQIISHTKQREKRLQQKFRIFALAKELNLDSKELIEACSKVGIVLKNALASITEEERDKVVGFLKESSGPGPGAAPKAQSTPSMAPVKPAAARVGKVPAIKTVAPRPTPSRLGPLSSKIHHGNPQSETEEIATETIVEELEPEVEYLPVEEVAEEASVPEVIAPEPSPTKIESEPQIEPVPPPEPVSKQESAVPERAEDQEIAPEPEKPTKQINPLRQEDYIPVSGTHSMKAIPNIRREVGGEPKPAQPQIPKKPKSKPGPSLPTLAPLGQFKGMKGAPVKPPEAPAQKPVQRLSPEVLASPQPLQAILKKNAEEKKNKKKPLEIVVEPEVVEDLTKPGKSKQAGAGLSTSRQERHARRMKVGDEDEEEVTVVRNKAPKSRPRRSTVMPLKTKAEIEPPITVRSLSETIGRPVKTLMSSLFINRGMNVTINSTIDEDLALELAMECGVELEILRPETYEDQIKREFDERRAGGVEARPPIITILGHVDHGKTTLLDKIRSANVAAGEAGGITQHIAAYQVDHNGQKLAFVDTPGHAAFSEMRARGANVTDIVVLVVAADDGVMPQTVEAINHAKAANVPIVVALNKCDLPGRKEDRVLQELAANNVLAVEWGGEVEVIRTSGATGLGLDTLLETLLLTAEVHELKGVTDGPGQGVCLEAFRDEGRGTLAWLIVQNGTLRVGDVVLCGEAHGRIRAMYNDRDREIKEAGPSTPIKISGLDLVPRPGERFYVVENVDSARQIAEERHSKGRAKTLASRVKPRTLEDILDPSKAGHIRDLMLIIKADTPGSLEALRHELTKFTHPEVRVKVIHEGVGGVNESDVYLASASNAIVIAFHVIPEDRAKALAEQEGVEIREYSIIYEVTDHIKKALEGLLKPEIQQVFTGRALVLRTFVISRVGTVAGCRVLNGNIERNSRIRVIRDNRILNDYAISSLKREKDDVKEVREGMECGIRIENFNDVKEGDLLEAFRTEEIKRKL